MYPDTMLKDLYAELRQIDNPDTESYYNVQIKAKIMQNGTSISHSEVFSLDPDSQETLDELEKTLED